MKRAGRRTILEVPKERRRLVGKHLWRYMLVAAGFAVAAILSMVWVSPLWRGFFAGVYLTAFVALVGHSFTLGGSHFRRMGAEAERWTSQELRKLRGWWVIDAVEFADRDIDHLAVGSRQVLAVETKWTSRAVTVDSDGVRGLWCDGLHHAERAARRARQLLRSTGVEVDVIPVLVLWGPEVPRIDGGYRRIGDVRVLIGRQSKDWRIRLNDHTDQKSVVGARPAIENYVRAFEDARTGG